MPVEKVQKFGMISGWLNYPSTADWPGLRHSLPQVLDEAEGKGPTGFFVSPLL